MRDISYEEFWEVGIALGWGLRLGSHLGLRLYHQFPKDDQRYEKLKRVLGVIFLLLSFLFFIFQSVSQVLFSYPFLVTSIDSWPELRLNEVLGAALSLVGMIGEWLSDRELKKFSSQPGIQGQVCDTGLWAYSPPS